MILKKKYIARFCWLLMKMFLSCGPFIALLVPSLWLLLSCVSCYGVQSDIDCLKGIKDAIDHFMEF